MGTANFVISDSLKKVLPPGVTGVLGGNVLERGNGVINYKTLTLTIDPLPPSTPPNRPEEFDINLVSVSVPWETDALPVVGSTVLFGLGVWTKRKLKPSKSSEKNNTKNS